MTIEYLSVDTLIRINAAQEGGVGVQSMSGVEANAARPQSGYGDFDTFPDVWTKAAAYVHAIGSTQYFTDGNKRTAWLAANMFLDGNGYELPDVSDIEAETLVYAVALNVWKTDADPDATIIKAGEWLRSKWQNQRVGATVDPRVEFAFIAEAVDSTDGSFQVLSGGIATFRAVDAAFPLTLEFSMLLRIHWRKEDAARRIVVSGDVVPKTARAKRVNRSHVEYVKGISIPSAHGYHRDRLMPSLFHLRFAPEFLESGAFTVRASFDGVLAAEINFSVGTVSSPPDTIEGII